MEIKAGIKMEIKVKVKVEVEVEVEVTKTTTTKETNLAVAKIMQKERIKEMEDSRTIRDLSTIRRRQVRASNKRRQRNDISHPSLALYLLPLM